MDRPPPSASPDGKRHARPVRAIFVGLGIVLVVWLARRPSPTAGAPVPPRATR